MMGSADILLQGWASLLDRTALPLVSSLTLSGYLHSKASDSL